MIRAARCARLRASGGAGRNRARRDQNGRRRCRCASSDAPIMPGRRGVRSETAEKACKTCTLIGVPPHDGRRTCGATIVTNRKGGKGNGFDAGTTADTFRTVGDDARETSHTFGTIGADAATTAHAVRTSGIDVRETARSARTIGVDAPETAHTLRTIDADAATIAHAVRTSGIDARATACRPLLVLVTTVTTSRAWRASASGASHTPTSLLYRRLARRPIWTVRPGPKWVPLNGFPKL
jgi:hypothetical protein